MRLRMYSHLASEFPVRKNMSTSTASSRARRVLLGLLATWAAAMIATSGPRSLQGGTDPSETPSPAPEHAVELADVDSADDPPEVLWNVLSGLDYMTGEVSAELQPFVGKEVKIPGFMVPLEDFAEDVSEFLLVPYVGACVHTPPPPPNQLVYVEMNHEEKVPVSFWDPIWIHGTLVVEETKNVYGSVSFRVDGLKVVPYEW